MPADLRKTDYLLDSGNYYRDTVDNLVEILKREQDDDVDQELTFIKAVTEVFDNDIIQIPSTPALAVTWQGATEEILTIGHSQTPSQTAIIRNLITVFYYHVELSADVRKNEIRDALWEVTRLIRRNADLNGLSSHGATITGVALRNRMRSEVAYAGGLVNVSVPVLIKTRRGLSR